MHSPQAHVMKLALCGRRALAFATLSMMPCGCNVLQDQECAHQEALELVQHRVHAVQLLSKKLLFVLLR